MKLHELTVLKGRKSSRRVGRGGKRGSYSGRGVKGQRSRAGRRIRPALRDLVSRIPKLRGFRNKPKSRKPVVVNVSDLERAVKALSSSAGPFLVGVAFLKKAGLVPASYAGPVKILGDGELSSAVSVSGMPVSKRAKMKIEKAGGKITPSKGEQ